VGATASSGADTARPTATTSSRRRERGVDTRPW
jgi:hypothetical protein